MPDGPGCFTQDSSCPALLRWRLARVVLPVRGSHPPRRGFPSRFPFDFACSLPLLLPRACRDTRGLGSSRSARRYSGNHFCFLLLRLLRCFSSAGSHPSRGRLSAGLPHSDIRGSKVICTSPRLFAAYRVLLRLLEPRHPPYALLYFVSGAALHGVV